MGKLAIICLGMALSSPAFAQSAENFNPASPTRVPSLPGTDKNAKSTPEKSGEVDSTPSRLVGPAELDAYLKAISSQFLIRTRERDPFGLVQNLDAVPAAKASIFGTTTATLAKPATPFRDIVPLIKVTSIIVRDKKILLGSRVFKQGELIPIQYQGKPLRVQITEVRSNHIVFRNLDTGETAIQSLGGPPVGMTLGGQGTSIQGMTLDSPDAPIELDADDSAP